MSPRKSPLALFPAAKQNVLKKNNPAARGKLIKLKLCFDSYVIVSRPHKVETKENSGKKLIKSIFHSPCYIKLDFLVSLLVGKR